MTLTALQLDPSKTTMLRRQYGRTLLADFDVLLRLIVLSIVDNNVLNLDELTGMVSFDPVTGRSILDRHVTVRGFDVWLGGASEDLLLVGRRNAPNQFVARALASGARQADIDLQRAGIIPRQQVSNRPQIVGARHQATLKALSDGNFARIQGMTADLQVRASDTVARGLAEGWKPSTVARQLEREIGVSKVRATAIARTEMVRASAEGKLDRYSQYGVQRVGAVIEARFTTAGDEDVCQICLGLESRNGGIYTIAEARGIIPVHTNCRCSWRPVRTAVSARGRSVIPSPVAFSRVPDL